MEHKDLAIPIASLFFSVPFRALSAALELGTVYQSTGLATAADAIAHLEGLEACLVIVSVSSREDLAQLAEVHRVIADPKRGKCVKFLVVPRMGGAFDKAMLKLGITDFIEVSSSPKGLRSKLDFWLKSLRAQVLARGLETSLGPGPREVQGPSHGEVIWEPGISFPEDIWTIGDAGDVKRVQNSWCVRLKGPAAEAADWIDAGLKGQWKLSSTRPEAAELPPRGAWFFWGSQKPVFLVEERVWVFRSEEMTLGYVIGGEVQFSRFRTMSPSIYVHHNSPAQTATPVGKTVLSLWPVEVGAAPQPTAQAPSSETPWYLDGKGYKQPGKVEEEERETKKDFTPRSEALPVLPLVPVDKIPEVAAIAPARAEENHDGALKKVTTDDVDDLYQRRLKSLLEKGAKQFRR